MAQRQRRKRLESSDSLTAQLIIAVQKGDLELVAHLLKQGATLTGRDASGRTALDYAATSVMTDFLRSGGSLRSLDYHLIAAIKRGDVSAAKQLYGMGAIINTANSETKEALKSAIEQGNMTAAWTLVRSGADFNTPDANGRTPLTAAANEGDLALIQEMIEVRADLNAKDQNGDTALMLAGETDNVEVVRALVEAGADLEIRDNGGNTALIRAGRSGSTDSAIELIRAGADVNAANEDGETVIMAAAENDDDELIEVAYDAGGNLDTINQYGETALIRAAEVGAHNATVTLCALGADLDIQRQPDGKTAAMVSIDNGHGKVAAKIIAAGASLTVPDKKGKNVLHHLAGKPDEKVLEPCAEVLRDRKQEEIDEASTQQDSEGYTPMARAVKGNNSGFMAVSRELTSLEAQGKILLTRADDGKTIFHLGEDADEKTIEELVKLCEANPELAREVIEWRDANGDKIFDPKATNYGTLRISSLALKLSRFRGTAGVVEDCEELIASFEDATREMASGLESELNLTGAPMPGTKDGVLVANLSGNLLLVDTPLPAEGSEPAQGNPQSGGVLGVLASASNNGPEEGASDATLTVTPLVLDATLPEETDTDGAEAPASATLDVSAMALARGKPKTPGALGTRITNEEDTEEQLPGVEKTSTRMT